MYKEKINIIFIVFLSIGLILLFYLVYNLLHTIQDYKEIIKLFMVFLLPMPLSIFLSFINSSRKIVEVQQTMKSKIISVIIFILTTSMLLIFLYLFDRYSMIKFKDLRLLPILINTMVTFAFSLNYLSNKNLTLSSILSGLLLGLALYFFI